MKTNKIFMIAVVGAALVSCGSKQSGKPNFADNEFAVRTVETQGTELQTSYPATMYRSDQRRLGLLQKYVCKKDKQWEWDNCSS